MPTDPAARWKEHIVGDWQAELVGVDLLYLEPAAGRLGMSLVFRADGTADLKLTAPNQPALPPGPTPPFPTTWELSKQRVLSVLIPIAPMPEYEMPDWTREAVSFDVLAVTDLSLTLSNRRFDGESVFVLRRRGREGHDPRPA